MLIFTIDDEPPALRASERIISEASPEAEVQGFASAADALAAIEQGSVPDVVFSDIEMPGLSGLRLAEELKAAAPGAHVIFVTGYSDYALEAFKVRAHGYVMKPLMVEDVRDELEALLPQGGAPGKLRVRCFGHFEAFWRERPLLFQRKQTKELLAFLVDRKGAACTTEEIAAALWEDETDMQAAGQRLRNLINDMRSTLREVGMEDLVVRDHRQVAVRTDLLDCDYYRMLAGDAGETDSFRGEYMAGYSWAEPTAARLFFGNARD